MNDADFFVARVRPEIESSRGLRMVQTHSSQHQFADPHGSLGVPDLNGDSAERSGTIGGPLVVGRNMVNPRHL